MDFETMIKLTDNILDTELRHIQEENEVADLKENIELQEVLKQRKDWEKILENELPKELKKIFNDFIDSFTNEQIVHEEYYFRKGVDAGLGKLRYLNDFGLDAAI